MQRRLDEFHEANEPDVRKKGFDNPLSIRGYARGAIVSRKSFKDIQNRASYIRID
jgi:hypothetical protein